MEEFQRLDPWIYSEERLGFERGLMLILKDSWRELHPEDRQYTWWSYYSRGREKTRDGELITG